MRTQKWPNDKHMFSSSSRTSSPTSPELWTVETELRTGLGRLRHFFVALVVSTLSVSPPRHLPEDGSSKKSFFRQVNVVTGRKEDKIMNHRHVSIVCPHQANMYQIWNICNPF
jgi:hypothetical protein